MQRIVVGISGASGMPFAFALLEALRDVILPGKAEVHLIISDASRQVLDKEGQIQGASHSSPLERLKNMAHVHYDANDFTAPPASGSWRHQGMVVCPCSMASLAAIATGCGHNLIHRAADVSLKERFPLVLVTRETPLSEVHIKNMLKARQAGAVVMPPCPAFYTGESTVEGMLRHFCGRILDQLGLQGVEFTRWGAEK